MTSKKPIKKDMAIIQPLDCGLPLEISLASLEEWPTLKDLTIPGLTIEDMTLPILTMEDLTPCFTMEDLDISERSDKHMNTKQTRGKRG